MTVFWIAYLFLVLGMFVGAGLIEWLELRRERGRAANRSSREYRAEQALMEMLTPQQQNGWKRHKRFELVGSRGGRYRIYIEQGSCAVARRWPTERHYEWFCFQLTDPYLYPLEDQALAMKCMIEANEDFVRREKGWAVRRRYWH